MHARLFVAISLLVGCNTDSPTSVEPTRVAPKPSRPATARVPQKSSEPIKKIDLSLGHGLEMRRPIVHGRLSLIPIITTRELPAQQFITLQEGMKQKLVKVYELPGGDGLDFVVDTVRVQNKASEPLAIISGEVLLDAHQDRVTAENTVIAAGETRNIRVRCVEKERDYGGGSFNPGNALAELSLRRVVTNSYQENVWYRVDEINRRDKTYNDTRSYRHAAKLLGTGAQGTVRDQIVAKLEGLEERNHIVGLAVAIDGEPVAIERFTTPDLYRHFEAKLIASYLPETSGQPARPVAPEAVRALSREPASVTAASHTILR